MPELLELTATDAAVRCAPMADRVLILPKPDVTESPGGVALPDYHHTDGESALPREGTVIAVGPGRWNPDGSRRIPMDVAPGDVVAFSRNSGNDFKVGGQEYLLVPERDIFVKLPKSE